MMNEEDRLKKRIDQESYSKTLNTQVVLKSKAQNLGQMTQCEKNLNKDTLTSFSSNTFTPINYMIPGLADNSQSVGAKALKRKGVD